MFIHCYKLYSLFGFKFLIINQIAISFGFENYLAQNNFHPNKWFGYMVENFGKYGNS